MSDIYKVSVALAMSALRKADRERGENVRRSARMAA